MAVNSYAPDRRAQQWTAPTALATAAFAVLLPLGYGGVGGVLLLVAVLAGAALTAAALWWTLTRRGPVRGAAAPLSVAAPTAVIVLLATTLLGALPLSLVELRAGHAAGLGSAAGLGQAKEARSSR